VARVTLAELIQQGKTIKAVCPRCNGPVTLPTEVTLIENSMRDRYNPTGQCHRCGVGWAWHTEKNPVGATAIRNEDKGKTNVWFCDRVLDASAPTIVE
jgi:hypothetical protein